MIQTSSNGGGHTRRGLPMAAGAALSMTILALAGEAAEVRLDHAWYRVELIVFERPYVDPPPVPPVPDAASEPAYGPPGEVLMRMEPRRFPGRALAFDDGEARAAYYPLDVDTLATPAVPVVDSAYLASIGVEAPPAAPEPMPSRTSENGETPAADPGSALPVVSPSERLAEATARFEQTLLAGSYQWLDGRGLVLGAEARRLGRADGFRLLHHGAWIQPVPPRESPEPMLLQIGPRQGDVWTVEGTLAVTLARYLHVHARLWHAGSAGADPGGTGMIRLESAHSVSYYELNEQRRLRTGELHYLDHPRFGLLIRIDPVELPEDLSALAATIP